MSGSAACIHIETMTEAEMKRVKYLLNKEAIRIPEGIIVFVNDKDQAYITDLVNQLMAKTAPDRTHLYRMTTEEFAHDEITKTARGTLEGTKESVEQIARYLVSKRKGIHQDSKLEGAKQYRIYTKKGNVDIITKVREKDEGKCELTLKIHGFRDAAMIIYQEFQRELDFFDESKGGNP